MNIEDLTPEHKEKLKACQTPEELLKVSREIGCELSEEELSTVSGGHLWSCSDETSCPPHVCGDVCAAGSTRMATVRTAAAKATHAMM